MKATTRLREEAATNKVRKLAVQILNKYYTDKALEKLVNLSPEPYRTMIYESGLVPNAEKIDGTPAYGAIVDELERIWAS